MIEAWIKQRWPQFSTKVGAFLATASVLLPSIASQLQMLKPAWAGYVTSAGAVIGIVLIVWNEKPLP